MKTKARFTYASNRSSDPPYKNELSPRNGDHYVLDLLTTHPAETDPKKGWYRKAKNAQAAADKLNAAEAAAERSYVETKGGWVVPKPDESVKAVGDPPSPEDKRAKRSAAAKKAMATRAANKAAQPAHVAATPAPSLGECESCCDGTLATEVVGVSKWINPEGYKYCAKCADLHRKNDRKHLIRQMGVPKVMGKFRTIDDLVKFGGKTIDFGDGDGFVYPTFADYIAKLKKKFLGNPKYDQTVVVEHIARLEKKMEATQ